MKNKIIMCYGVSGSGKSTYAIKMAEKGFKIFSSDVLREELYGDVNDQKHNKELFKILEARIVEALKNGENVVYDATNLNKKNRINFLKKIKDINCVKECNVFALSVEKCIENDKARDRHVGEEVIKKQISKMQPPSYDEGWDIINF